jgi:hypothetical protein
MPDRISHALAEAYHDALALISSSLPPGYLAEITKIAIGSFVGAGLAILLAWLRHNALRRRERKAAGNLAIATLDRLANDFALARAVILNYREFILREQPRLPPWMHIKPAHFSHASMLHFDRSSLAFLLDGERGVQMMKTLIAAESAYHDFFGLLRDYVAVAEAIREKLALAGLDPMDAAQARDFTDVAGPAVVAKAERLAHAILAHVERSETAFREAAIALPAVLGSRLGKKGVARIEVPTYSQLRKRLELSEDDLRTPPIRP